MKRILLLVAAWAISSWAVNFNTIPDMTWVPITASGGQTSGRAEFTTTYDHINNVWITGFGCTNPCYSSDTYEYDPVADAWQTTFPIYCRGSAPSDRPDGRCSGGFAFGYRDTVAVLFGWANVGNPPDTWIYSATRNTWTSKGRQNLGGGYEGFQVVYDGVTDCYYTFDAHGTTTGRGMYRYSIANNVWAKAQVNTAPTQAECYYCYCMAVSESRRIILVVATGSGDDWIYKIDTHQWLKLNSNSSLHGPRYRSGLVYDIANDVFLLLGTKDAGRDMFALSLSSDNTSGAWTNITSQVKGISLPERGQSMTYDRTHNVSYINEYTSGGGSIRAAFRYGKGAAVEFSTAPRGSFPAISCFPSPAAFPVRISWTGLSPHSDFGVYNAAGALVRSFTADASAGQLVWDGKDNRDETLAQGVYVIRLDSEDRRFSRSIILAK